MRTLLVVLVVFLGVRSALAGGTVLQQGLDYWHTPPEGASITFGEFIPPIPADFFNPGSDPFLGTVLLQGVPLSPTTGDADTIVRRLADSAPLPPGGVTQVPIELVELRLTSTQPITVQPGGQQWDVHIELAPGDPSLGQAPIQLNSPADGAMGYQLQFRPTITFTPVGGGPALELDLGPTFMQPLNSAPAPFTTSPPPVVLADQGPNLFPIAPMSAAGPGFQHTLVPADPFGGFVDCNGNAQADDVDIDLGISLDSNRNGIPDECEIVIRGVQYSWPDFAGGFVQRFSQHGAIRITVPEPPPGQAGWFNAVLGDSGWAVQNFPVHEINMQGSMRSIVIPVPLPTDPGVALEQGTIIFTYTPAPRETAPPPTSLALEILIHEHTISPGQVGPIEVALPIDPGPIGPFINPFIPVLWEFSARRDVPGVDEDTEHCAPGSAARSFAWLNNTYCLDLPDDCDEAQEIYDMLRDMDHMDTDPVDGTDSIEKMVEGIQQLIEDKGLEDELTVEYDSDSSGDTIFEALEAGYDVMGIIYWRDADGNIRGGHAITIVGAIRCGENVVIDYRDDVHGEDSQGDGEADADDTKGGRIEPSAGGGHSLAGHGRNSWEGIVKICPTRKRTTEAAMKWAAGDLSSGGSTEGIKSLAQAILDGHVPSLIEILSLVRWACNLEDNACALVAQVTACGTPQMLQLAMAIKARASAAKLGVLDYFFQSDPTSLDDVVTALDADFDADLAALLALLDCDGNGVDDKLDIARGDLHDANHNMVPDECECLADWNSDGIVSVPDIFAFLASWFAGDADANHDGVTSVPDIFAFLALWFAGCPD